MTEDLFRLLYCSRNVMAPDVLGRQLPQIVAAGRRVNEAAGVTGALLYNDGVFAQLLEGPFPAVRRIFERIQDDPRHQEVVLIQAHTAASRIFGGWALALVEAEDRWGANRILRQALIDPGTEGPHNVLLLLEELVQRQPQREAVAA